MNHVQKQLLASGKSLPVTSIARWIGLPRELAFIHCGRDAWCIFVPVIYCCTREVLGHALKQTGQTQTPSLDLPLQPSPPSLITQYKSPHQYPQHLCQPAAYITIKNVQLTGQQYIFYDSFPLTPNPEYTPWTRYSSENILERQRQNSAF